MHILSENTNKSQYVVSPIVKGAGRQRWFAESATEAIGLIRGMRQGSLLSLASLFTPARQCYRDYIALTFLGTNYAQQENSHSEALYAKN